MKSRGWWGTLIVLVIGAAAGVVAIAATNSMVHWSSSNEFCSTACHSMQWVASAYERGPHAKTRTGVTAGCSDCHIPYESQKANAFQYVALLAYKAQAGMRDAYHEARGTIGTEQKWLAERERLSGQVKAFMTSNSSLTCRGCHELDRMANPEKPAVAEMHAPLLKQNPVVCIECHTNVGHDYDKPKSAHANTSATR
jgi:nitrate/TMAO reductase-like tetraheme cytochrome c subunit